MGVVPMKVFAVPRLGAFVPRPPFRSVIRARLRRAVETFVALNRCIDQARVRRDHANQECGNVDGAFWVFLR